MSGLRQRGAMVEFPIKSDKQRLIVTGVNFINVILEHFLYERRFLKLPK